MAGSFISVAGALWLCSFSGFGGLLVGFTFGSWWATRPKRFFDRDTY